MSSKIEVVVPIGVGNPDFDTPTISMLETGLESIKTQSTWVKLTVAVDENLPKDKLGIIAKYADKVKIFPSASYFRPGGIWDKIWTCWEESEADFLAWQGYDDHSSFDRFEKQLEAIENSKANACFGMQYKYDKSSGRVWLENTGEFSLESWLNYLGSHVPYMGGFLLRKNAILNSGIAEYRYKWSYYFEGLLYAFILKTGLPCNSEGSFYFGMHPASISETKNDKWMKEQQELAGYSFEQAKADWDSIPFQEIINQVKQLYGY